MTRTLRIVAADDDPRIRSFYEAFIPHLGHQLVGCADSGEALLALCSRCPPDLIITDIRMGAIDGLRAVEQINLKRTIPVIVVSAYDDELNTDRAERPWIRMRLLKPVTERELQRAIDRAATTDE